MRTLLCVCCCVFLSLSSFSQPKDWAWITGTSKDEVIRAMDVDKDGNTYITGLYAITFDADPGPAVYLVSHTGIWPHTYVAKYNPSGELIWAKGYGMEEVAKL